MGAPCERTRPSHGSSCSGPAATPRTLPAALPHGCVCPLPHRTRAPHSEPAPAIHVPRVAILCPLFFPALLRCPRSTRDEAPRVYREREACTGKTLAMESLTSRHLTDVHFGFFFGEDTGVLLSQRLSVVRGGVLGHVAMFQASASDLAHRQLEVWALFSLYSHGFSESTSLGHFHSLDCQSHYLRDRQCVCAGPMLSFHQNLNPRYLLSAASRPGVFPSVRSFQSSDEPEL